MNHQKHTTACVTLGVLALLVVTLYALFATPAEVTGLHSCAPLKESPVSYSGAAIPFATVAVALTSGGDKQLAGSHASVGGEKFRRVESNATVMPFPVNAAGQLQPLIYTRRHRA